MSQARAVVADFTFTPLAITPTSHDFGTIDIDAGPATTQTFTVSNPSDGTVTTGVVGIVGSASSSTSRLMGFSGGVPMVFGLNGFAPTSAVDQFALTDNTCSNISLAPGASCTATAGFDPAFTGSASSLINVPSNAYPDPSQASLVGTGVTAKWTLRGEVVGGGSVSATSGGTRTNLTGCTSAGGVSCVGYITRGGTARLVPEPEVGWVFDGWSGDLGSGECTDRAACVVTMTSDRTITTRFVRSWTLTTAVAGAGNGTVDATVNGAPSGVTGCSSSSGVCSADYNDGTIVTLTATPASGSTVTEWSGDCVGAAATCVVTMSQARTVQATFALGSRALAKAGLTVTLKATRTTFVSRQKGILHMTATNTTSEHLTDVTLVIHVPNGFVVLSATGARITRHTVTWTGLRLVPGQSVTRDVQVMALGTRHRRKSPAVAKATAPTTAPSTGKRVLVVHPLPPRKQGLVTG